MSDSSKSTIRDASYYIKKFRAIPDEKWIVGFLVDDNDPSKRCAFGHCGAITQGHVRYTEPPELLSLEGVLKQWVESRGKVLVKGELVTPQINDGPDEDFFPEPLTWPTSPRARILYALERAKETGL